MKKMTMKKVIILIFTCFLSLQISGQVTEPIKKNDFLRFRAWFEGYRVKNANYNNEKNYEKLTYLGMGLEYILTDSVGIKVQVGFTFPELTEDSTLDEDDISRVFWQGDIYLTYHFNPRNDFDIYAQAGLGSMGGVRIPDKELDPEDEAEVGLILYPIAGIGVNYFFEKHFFIGAEARWILEKKNLRASDLKSFTVDDFQLGFKVGLAL